MGIVRWDELRFRPIFCFPAVDARIVHGVFAHGIGAVIVFETALSQCGRRCWPCKARTVHYKYVYLSFGQHGILCGHQRLSTLWVPACFPVSTCSSTTRGK